MKKHVRNCQVIVENHLAVGVQDWLPGALVQFRKYETLRAGNEVLEFWFPKSGINSHWLRRQSHCDYSGKDHQKREEHLRHRSDERCTAGCAHGLSRHGTLHHEKICTPVA